MQYLAGRNLPFRGNVEKLGETGNGNFLGQVELAKFDSVIAERIRRICQKEISNHYLGKNIQNELIELMMNEVLQQIILVIKRSKYYSIMLDCTPDVSRLKQMSVIIRILDFTSGEINVKDNFLGFLNVKNTTGKGLTETVLMFLEQYGIDIKNCRGQAYDNGRT